MLKQKCLLFGRAQLDEPKDAGYANIVNSSLRLKRKNYHRSWRTYSAFENIFEIKLSTSPIAETFPNCGHLPPNTCRVKRRKFAKKTCVICGRHRPAPFRKTTPNTVAHVTYTPSNRECWQKFRRFNG